jgi:lipocalin-like protein
MTKLTLTVFSVILILSSCKKDSNSPNGVSAILISGKWQITASTSVFTIAGDTQTVDNFSLLPSCMQDNYYIFNSDGTGTTDEGTTKCDDSDPQTTSTGNWQLVNNDTQLQGGDITGTEVTADIKQLDNSTMVLEYTTDANGISSTTTTTYHHIN